MREYNEKTREEIRQAYPKLMQIKEIIGDNKYLQDSIHGINGAMGIAERCMKFDIWTDNTYFGQGLGIYTMQQIYDERYDPEHPEELLVISFPSGPYIFCRNADHYDHEYFDRFYSELREATDPDYEYEKGHELYFKPEKARKAWDTYEALFEKYREGSKDRWLETEIKEAEERLESLKAKRRMG